MNYELGTIKYKVDTKKIYSQTPVNPKKNWFLFIQRIQITYTHGHIQKKSIFIPSENTKYIKCMCYQVCKYSKRT